MPEPPLLVIGGPTASGKTSLALGLAKHLPIEVISADSRQVYRGLDVGTAKPTPAERRRAPHHVLDIIDPSEPFSAHRFSGLARAAIVDIERRGARPVVVGGTGFYIQALLTGSPLGATPPDPELRSRLIRALEIAESQRHQPATNRSIPAYILGLQVEPATLAKRIAQRTERMVRSTLRGEGGQSAIKPAHPLEAHPHGRDTYR